MKHGFIKVGAAVPSVTVASPEKNAEEICRLIDKADGCAVLVFPELSVTGCTCGDLFLTDGLYKRTVEAIGKIKNHTAGKKMLVFVGAPVRVNGKMYNCAVALNDGHVAGIVPKNYDKEAYKKDLDAHAKNQPTTLDFSHAEMQSCWVANGASFGDVNDTDQWKPLG